MGVPEPRPVQVQADAGLVGERPQGAQLADVLDCPTAEVVRVLDGHRPCGDQVRAAIGDGHRDHVGRSEQTPRRVPGPGGDPTEHGVRAQLRADDVRQAVAQQLRPRRHEQAHAELVAQRTARHEQARLVPEQPGDPLLERGDGGVLPVDIVADIGLRHRPAHPFNGARHSVRAQVDRLHGRRA